MCGIAGVLHADGSRRPMEGIVAAMAGALRHRGPDAGGLWCDTDAGIALGHRRLSILDLSPAGAQPMHSPGGRYVLSFNGEIYNFPELRRELGSGIRYRGHSDTEVAAAAIERWGFEGALRKFDGMFALAVWDRQERRLLLGRDPMGIKPLYYGSAGRSVIFASELFAFHAHPDFAAEIDRDAITLLLRYKCIPAPHSIYRGVFKLPPGSWLELRSPADVEAPPRAYWSLEEVARAGALEPFTGAPEEAVDRLESLLRQSIRGRLLSDVPVGVFLSGGVDSSAVAALMAEQSAERVRSYSIGFRERGYDEADSAALVARHLGTEHTELYVTPREVLDLVPTLPSLLDEPFADSSLVPSHLLARLARRDITVALSGDGGDELFSGYNRHIWAPRLWRSLRRIPLPLRKGVGALAGLAPAELWDRALERAARMLPALLRHRNAGYKVHRLAAALHATDASDLYRRLVSHWQEPDAVVIGGREPASAASRAVPPEVRGGAAALAFLDMSWYLPDDILTKVDRATMAVGLEARVPLLDHRVIEFALSLPPELKLGPGGSKWALRQVLYRHVPRELVDRPKTGFGMPVGEWLRGPLRPWAEALLDERRLAQEGFFDPAPIRSRWRDHLEGRGSWQYQLWDVLSFQIWLEAERERRRIPVGAARAAGGAW